LKIALVSNISVSAGVAGLFLIPFVLRDQSYSVAATGFILLANVAGSVLGTPLIGNIADRFGTVKPLVFSFAIAGAALGLLSLVAANTVVTVVCLAIFGGTTGGAQALTQSITADAAKALGIGTAGALGSMRLVQFIMPTFAPSLAGVIYVRFGPGAALAAVAVLLLVAALVAMRMMRPADRMDVIAVPNLA
jgi:MFS family permease